MQQGNYLGMLFVGFAVRLPYKLVNVGISHTNYMWINSFLTGRSQRVRVGQHTSSAPSITKGFSGLRAEALAVHSLHA